MKKRTSAPKRGFSGNTAALSNKEITKFEKGVSKGNDTQFNDEPVNPVHEKFVIRETRIQQAQTGSLQIDKFRNAESAAKSRYYPTRSWLYDIYEDSLLDGHLTGVIQKRIDTVLNKTLAFKKSDKEVDELADLMKTTEFRQVCKTFLETMFWGTSGLEFIPGPVFKAKAIPRKHINRKYQLITIEQDGEEGIDYTTAKNIIITGEPEDLGYLLKCAAYIIYKRQGLGDWSQYISIFGQPVRVMFYDTNDHQAKIELKETLDNSGSSLALMIPKGVDFDLKDGKQSNGDGKLQETFINFCNREISIIVLGNTETTTHDGKTGTGGKSAIHQKQQEELYKSDMHYLLSILNSSQFLNILKTYGYPVEGGRFSSTEEISIEYLAARVKIDAQLVALGVPIDDDYFYETYGIPKPKNYKELKKKLEQISKQLQKETGQDPDEEENEDKPKPKKKPQAKKVAKTRFKRLRNFLRKSGLAAFFSWARG